MDPISLVILLLVTIVIGAMVGCVGIGGVLIVPYLTFVMGVEAHLAIAAAMFSYMFSGVVATLAYARHRSIEWHMVWVMCGAAAPAALAGSVFGWRVPGPLLLGGIAGLTLFAAWRALDTRRGSNIEARPIGLPVLAMVGGVAGFVCALTGTGGAIVVIPLLFAIGAPALTAIGLSQAIQLPIASLATAGNLWVGEVDFVIGGTLALGLMLGVAAGARMAHALPVERLRRFVAWTLVVVGVLILVQLAEGWVNA